MYSLDEILRMSVEEKASDIHFTAGCPPYYRIDGVLTPLKGDKLQPTDLEALLLPILDNRHRNELEINGQTDLAYAILKCTLCQGHYDFFLFRFLLYICLLCRGIKVMPLIDCFHLLL